MGKKIRENGWLLVLEWGLLLAALTCFTITEVYCLFVIVGFALLALSLAVRWMRWGRLWRRRTGLEGPWLLFIISACIGLLVSYDRPSSLLKLARILAAGYLFLALVEANAQVQRWAAIGLTLLATWLAFYWPLQHDFTAEPGKFTVVTVIGQWLNAHTISPLGPAIHPTAAGGTLAIALPFALALTVDAWESRRTVCRWLTILVCMLFCFTLVMTSNRGAWLGLTGAALLAFLTWAQRRYLGQGTAKVAFLGGILVLAAIAMLAITANLDAVLGQIPDPTGSLRHRLTLWQEGWMLIRDHAFTGIGLGAFPMVYSTYVLLIHVPFLTEVHNTFLEIWIEQGVLGAFALLWGSTVYLVRLWQLLSGERVPRLAWAGLAAVTASAIHGVFDAPFYVARTLPLLGFIAAYAWWPEPDSRVANEGEKQAKLAGAPFRSGGRAWRQRVGLSIGLVVLLLVLVFHRPLLGLWYANLGAVLQMQAELTVYDPDHFDNPTLDRVRQTVKLDAAEVYLKKAIAWDAGNVTARQRLAAIALSRGAYEDALALLEPIRSGDPVTRLLLGDALVATGQVEQAAEVVRGFAWAESRLQFQAWYRYWVNGDFQRTADAWQAVLLLNPTNKSAAYWIAEAKRKAGDQR